MMRSLNPIGRLTTLVLLFVVAGCFRLSRNAPPVQYFVLGAIAAPDASRVATNGVPPAVAPRAERGGVTLGLRRPNLASYLAVPAIVTRRGAHEIVVSDFHRWGEDLGEAINRVVAGHLANSGRIVAVDIAPWATRVRHDYLVQLHVSRFEGVTESGAAEGRSQVAADWDIIRPLDGRVLVRGRTDAGGSPWRLGDYASLVMGLDAALVRVARDVASCLSRFPNDSTPPPSCP